MEIEASQIKFGGGKVLLFDLLDYLYKTNQNAKVWIESKTIYKEIQQKYNSYFDLQHTTQLATLFRYMKRRENVLFFCSIPPLVKCTKSLVYFHNLHYAKLFSERLYYLKNKQFRVFLKIYFYHLWIFLFKGNCDNWGCQIKDIADRLERVYNLQPLLLPFYSLPVIQISEKKFDFCYVSYPYPHKNHETLLNGIDKLAQKRFFTIALTIPKEEQFAGLLDRIDEINKKHHHEIISNVGFIDRNEVFKLYCMSRFLIFPSTLETLGIPLIEAYHCGLKVLSSDLDFSYASIGNVVTFDPSNENSISKIMENALNGLYDDIKQDALIPNRIEEIISLVKKDN